MTHDSLLTPALLCLSLLASPTLRISAQETSGPRVDAVLAFERIGCAAYERNDAKAIDSLVADGYALTDSHGVITTKDDDLKAARNQDIRFTTFHNEHMQVRIYDNTAIVTGRTILKGTTKEGAPVDVEVQFTDTVVLLGGRWRLVAGHVSRIRS